MEVRLNKLDKIERRLGIEAGGEVQKFLTDNVANRMDKYIPFKTGALRRNKVVADDSITYESKYAESQYKGMVGEKPVRHYTTPGTGSYWDRRLKNIEIEFIINDVQRFMRRGGK